MLKCFAFKFVFIDEILLIFTFVDSLQKEKKLLPHLFSTFFFSVTKRANSLQFKLEETVEAVENVQN